MSYISFKIKAESISTFDTNGLKFKMKNNRKFKIFLEKRFPLLQNSAKIWAALAS